VSRRAGLVALVALTLAACGSSGSHSAAPLPTTTTAPVVAMPACPAQPVEPQSRGAAGNRLVELDATRLRVCLYAGAGFSLSAQGDLTDPGAVAALERTGNAFRYPAVQNFMCPRFVEDNPRELLAMFAHSNGVATILVRDSRCPAFRATNGHAAAFTSQAWFDALLTVATA
jgi:hypothetical protein